MTIDLRPFISVADFSSDTFESFVHFFLVSMTASLGKEEELDSVIAKAHGGSEKREKAEVKLEINGVEFPFLDAMKRLYEQWESIVRRKALEMVLNEFSEKTNSIYALLNEFEEKLRETWREENDCKHG